MDVILDPTSLTLTQGERRDVVLSVTPWGAGRLEAQLQAACGDVVARGLAQVDATLLPLTASKSVDRSTAKPGDVLTYTLTVTNPNPVPMTEVVLTDPLDAHVRFLDATPAPQVQGQTLTFLLGTVPAQGSATVTFRVHLDKTDDLTVPNVARVVTAEQPQGIPTNTVKTTVWDPKLVISKVSGKTIVQVGDTVTYTVTVTNASTAAALDETTVQDRLPAGLALNAGTLRLNGQRVVDINPDPQIIEVAGGALTPGQTTVLTYTTTVTPEAIGRLSLRNVAQASGVRSAQVTERVSTTEVDAIVKLAPADRAVLLGRVYLDVDGNGQFSAADRPVQGARVVVAGGEAALTDTLGRYAVPDLREGRYAVVLDRASVPYSPAAQPGGLLLGGAQLVNIYGTATADFPLLPPTGSGSAGRSTVLTGQGWRAEKQVQRQGTEVHVTLTLRAERDMTLQLDDPLPTGAALLQGQSNQRVTVRAQVPVTLSYTFQSDLPDAALTTDPVIHAGDPPK
ncbi:Conserved repeat domain protein (plasmid) [Deinococcus gobiensis I-0]|uniref:Conserved repeat domain protein n=2 Tax=Deinococcus TaxID=1298 RepID=H8H2X8_DEIGI|nr:Conserved repeat domain protein [Deinococcus gobiensis I-0]